MSDILALLAVRQRAPQVLFKTVELDIEALKAQLYTRAELIEVASPEDRLTAAELLYPKVNHNSAQEEWVCATGQCLRIGDMDPTHLVHVLAKIVREARKGHAWVMGIDGMLRFRQSPCWVTAAWDRGLRERRQD